jgi:hypothetical protein
MAQQFTNNARALLTSSITLEATSLVVESTKADLFPVANVGTGSIPSADSWFKVTLQDSSGNVEIVAVRTRTAGSGVLANVIRGYDGTVARAFTAGTVVGLRITAEDVQTALDLPNQNSVFTGDNSFSGTNEFTGTQTFSGITSFSDDVVFNDSPTAPTAPYGTSNTELATTAFVQAALQALYPVGSIYTNAGVTTNPAVLFGFGTWIAFGAGRVPVGLNPSDPLFDSLEETGGSKDATVVSHSHGFSGSTSGVGDHQHESGTGVQDLGAAFGRGGNSTSYRIDLVLQAQNTPYTSGAGAHSHSFSGTTAASGSSGTNANLQPYVTVAMWKRTA